nr:MAG TPA: virion morphogenesis protein [Caudoviricetes sp.]
MRFVVSTDGLDEALGTLRLLATKGEDLTTMLDELGQDEVARVVQRFEQSRSPGGTAWQVLKRPRPRGGDRPLQDTGVLMSSITAQVHGNTLQIGTATDYAHYHQFGTQHIPARPFLGISDDLLASIKELTHAYFNL